MPYVLRKRRGLFAVLDIPRAIRHHYQGKTKLIRTLKTTDPRIAERRAAILVSTWKADFDRLKGGNDDAAFYRTLPEGSAKQAAIALEMQNRSSPSFATYAGDPEAGEKWEEAAKAAQADAADFLKRATGQITPTMAHVDAYLERQSTSPKTKAMAKSDIEGFARTFPTLQDVSYEGAQRWVDNLGVAPATVRRTLSSIRGYWRYCQRPDVKAVAKDNMPLANLDLPKAKNGAAGKRKAFTAKDLLKLVAATAIPDPQLKDLIWMAMYTGARIEELCSLKTKSVHLHATIPYFAVEDSKTKAGVREIPIHSRLLPMMKALSKASSDGYVLSNLPSDKYGDRSPAIGKRFGRLKTKMGYRIQHNFHSIRRTVSNQFEEAGVLENVASHILGHELDTMSYGTYGSGVSLKVKAKAIAKIRY